MTHITRISLERHKSGLARRLEVNGVITGLLDLQNCDVLRRAAEAGGLLLDAMANSKDGSKANPASVPLMVVENGCGSPCIDLRQVSSELAEAAKDADLVRETPPRLVPHRALFYLFIYSFIHS